MYNDLEVEIMKPSYKHFQWL